MGYSCQDCYAIPAAVSGWLYKTGKRVKGGRWRCTACNAPWDGDSDHAVAYVFRWEDTVLTFYGRYGHSDWIRKNWPELHQRWHHWRMERCEYFAKYESFKPLRDEPI